LKENLETQNFGKGAYIMIDAKVDRVVDGDTIEVTAKLKIRMDFIDAPETKGVEKVKGAVSKDWLKKRIEGKTVQLDVKTKDMYDRFLSVVYQDDVNINGEMVKQHLAEIYSPANHNDGKED
jgi:endonuclease YncB( thermonuclease family)